MLTGPPSSRPALVDLVNCFTKSLSLMMCANVVAVSTTQHAQTYASSSEDYIDFALILLIFGLAMFQLSDHSSWQLKSLSIQPCYCQDGPSSSAAETANSNCHVAWLNHRKVKSFYRGVVAAELRSGVNMLLQVGIKTHILFCSNEMAALIELGHVWG